MGNAPRSRFFVIVLKLQGALFTDYGWAATPEQLIADMRYRVTHPARYTKYAGIVRTAFANYRVRDITEFRDWRKNPASARAIKCIVRRLRRAVRHRPIT
jgi:hypothetical protein